MDDLVRRLERWASRGWMWLGHRELLWEAVDELKRLEEAVQSHAAESTIRPRDEGSR